MTRPKGIVGYRGAGPRARARRAMIREYRSQLAESPEHQSKASRIKSDKVIIGSAMLLSLRERGVRHYEKQRDERRKNP